MSMAKGVVPDDSPSSAASARSFTLGQADVVLLIGARLNWMLSNGEAPLFNEDAKFVQVDIDATEFDSNRKIDAPLQGDITSVLQKLNAALEKANVKALKTGQIQLRMLVKLTMKNLLKELLLQKLSQLQAFTVRLNPSMT